MPLLVPVTIPQLIFSELPLTTKILPVRIFRSAQKTVNASAYDKIFILFPPPIRRQVCQLAETFLAFCKFSRARQYALLQFRRPMFRRPNNVLQCIRHVVQGSAEDTEFVVAHAVARMCRSLAARRAANSMVLRTDLVRIFPAVFGQLSPFAQD